MKTLFLSVGDASGDEHCALLVRELLRRHPDWKIVGLAGPRCQAAGAQLLASTQGMGVIGVASALALVPRSWRLRRIALDWIEHNKPDGAIFCDWGGFNKRILPDLKRLNVPVLYYFPPGSWLKGGQGGTEIAPFVQSVATPFEWSAQKLQSAGVNAKWVGHPILEKVAALPPREELREKFELYRDDVVVALLAGSRDMEINAITPHLVGAIERLWKADRKQRFRFVFAAPPGKAASVDRFLSPVQDLVDETIEGQTLDLLRAADIGLIKSGTSTLEAAALDVPQVIVYDGSPALKLQVHLTGLRKKFPLVGMPNIILDRQACPELLGNDCRAPTIARAVLDLLDSPERLARMRADYALVRRALGEGLPQSATQATAEMIESLLGEPRAGATG